MGNDMFYKPSDIKNLPLYRPETIGDDLLYAPNNIKCVPFYRPEIIGNDMFYRPSDINDVPFYRPEIIGNDLFREPRHQKCTVLYAKDHRNRVGRVTFVKCKKSNEIMIFWV